MQVFSPAAPAGRQDERPESASWVDSLGEDGASVAESGAGGLSQAAGFGAWQSESGFCICN